LLAAREHWRMVKGSILRELATLVAPPLCSVCAAPCAAVAVLCRSCVRALDLAPPGVRMLPEVGEIVWAARHDGTARQLIRALKFAERTALAQVAATRIAAAISPRAAPTAVVPVPPAPARHRRRGFDPAGLIACELATLLGVPLVACLARLDGGRQVGRRRAARISDPPRIGCREGSPAGALLVDDVLTTGATLRACATAMRRGGTPPAGAAVFAAALGSRGGAA
jgi:predicted amidophosphoribosyltransferase